MTITRGKTKNLYWLILLFLIPLNIFSARGIEDLSNKTGSLAQVEEKESENLLPDADDDTGGLLKIYLVIAIILNLILVIVIYNRYLLRQKINKQLQMSEGKYRALFSEAGEAILLMEDDIIIDCNGKTLELFCLERDDIIGHSFHEFFPEPGMEEDSKGNNGSQREKRINKALSGDTQRFYWRHHKKNGNLLHTNISLSMVKIDKKMLVQAIVHNITEQKQLEEQRLVTAKLEAIGILAGGIAHDFNNVLAVIMGNVNLARMHSKTGDKLSQILTKIEESTLSATSLANQFLTFAEGGHPIKREVALSKNIRETVESALTGANQSYNIDISRDLRIISCDIEQIERVIHGIVINAREACDGNGKITIKAGNVVLNEDEVCQLKGGDYIKISVEDNGKGISEENLPKIFDPYFTTRKDVTRKGTGLGLSIAHSIIKQHNGIIDVSSEVGGGSVFSIFLPV